MEAVEDNTKIAGLERGAGWGMTQPSQNRAAHLSRQSLVADVLRLAQKVRTLFSVPNWRMNVLPHQSTGQSLSDQIPWMPHPGLGDTVPWLLQLI